MMRRFQRLSARNKILIIVTMLLTGSGVVLGAVRLGRRGPSVPTIEVKRGERTARTKPLIVVKEPIAPEAGERPPQPP